MARFHEQLSLVQGATLFLQAVQDIRIGRRSSNAPVSVALRGQRRQARAYAWSPKLRWRRYDTSSVSSGETGQQQNRHPTNIVIDRSTAGRLRPFGQPNRRHALRCLRTTPSLHHLQRHQSMPCRSWRITHSTGRVRRRSRTSSFRLPARRQAAPATADAPAGAVGAGFHVVTDVAPEHGDDLERRRFPPATPAPDALSSSGESTHLQVRRLARRRGHDFHLPRWLVTPLAPRRSLSTIEGCSLPRRSLSTCDRAHSLSDADRRGRAGHRRNPHANDDTG